MWLFDHSSCHAAMPDDALDVNKMNVNPGGKQRVMRDGWWGGKSQKMTYNLGIPKGMRVVLEERGVNTHKMTADKMREILLSHPDFANEKSSIERFLGEEKRHIVYLIPKYHCELNPIERVWAQAKRYSKAYCKYNLTSLHTTVVPALESVPLESIQKHFRKVRHYMFGYLESLPGGSDLENLVKNTRRKFNPIGAFQNSSNWADLEICLYINAFITFQFSFLIDLLFHVCPLLCSSLIV